MTPRTWPLYWESLGSVVLTPAPTLLFSIPLTSPQHRPHGGERSSRPLSWSSPLPVPDTQRAPHPWGLWPQPPGPGTAECQSPRHRRFAHSPPAESGHPRSSSDTGNASRDGQQGLVLQRLTGALGGTPTRLDGDTRSFLGNHKALRVQLGI